MGEHVAQGRSGRRPRRLGAAIVRGDSMYPTLRSGDRLLVTYGTPVRAGHVVVARLPDGTVAVKRAAERRPGGWWLLGDNPARSTDSTRWGVIAEHDVWAVARLRIAPRPALLRRRRTQD
ncbi:S24/S26 family peptidase [Nocardioides sp. zg-536]|uniref:S24/S26 family peptidase n=1 Tax=Nocardioides faecalis TaxID=2803858 RepID=A0A939BZF1_9ACTN|nr:S24/S26 family peptidase [Nocardioides faecalis]MBM9461248.1 S24/S26 family peptidase [Nocardioides faecalis]MBS4752447.1 S24/S26 family peptidase [Nocardioides faecalis]QVI57731.1 S24/S26 family peptidase [Nocardioides faecalis]